MGDEWVSEFCGGKTGRSRLLTMTRGTTRLWWWCGQERVRGSKWMMGSRQVVYKGHRECKKKSGRANETPSAGDQFPSVRPFRSNRAALDPAPTSFLIRSPPTQRHTPRGLDLNILSGFTPTRNSCHRRLTNLFSSTLLAIYTTVSRGVQRFETLY